MIRIPLPQGAALLTCALLAGCQVPMLPPPPQTTAAAAQPAPELVAQKLTELYAQLGVTPGPEPWLASQARAPSADCVLVGDWRRVDDRDYRLRVTPDGSHLTVLDGDENPTPYRYAFDGSRGVHVYHHLEQVDGTWVLLAFLADLTRDGERLVWTFRARGCVWAKGKKVFSPKVVRHEYQRAEGAGS